MTTGTDDERRHTLRRRREIGIELRPALVGVIVTGEVDIDATARKQTPERVERRRVALRPRRQARMMLIARLQPPSSRPVAPATRCTAASRRHTRRSSSSSSTRRAATRQPSIRTSRAVSRRTSDTRRGSCHARTRARRRTCVTRRRVGDRGEAAEHRSRAKPVQELQTRSALVDVAESENLSGIPGRDQGRERPCSCPLSGPSPIAATTTPCPLSAGTERGVKLTLGAGRRKPRWRASR